MKTPRGRPHALAAKPERSIYRGTFENRGPPQGAVDDAPSLPARLRPVNARAMAKLIVMSGLPAAGKSTIARALAQRIGAIWLRVDSMDQAIWASGTAPQDLQDWTYRAAQAVAADNLALGRDVIADCVNGYPAAHEGWERAAAPSGSEIVWLRIICSDLAEHRRRVETRDVGIPGLPLPDWDAVLARDNLAWVRDHRTIDTAGRPLDTCVAEAMEASAA